jgi:hypothetical protein
VNPRTEQQLEEAFGSGSIATPLDALVRLPDDEMAPDAGRPSRRDVLRDAAAARSMAPRGTGSIVNIASICGIAGLHGLSALLRGEGGILAFTRAVAKELIVQGVRVNASRRASFRRRRPR